MSDIDGMSIDELLSSYIDGELTLRQATEVKRLILHDKNVAEKLRELERQRALLGALPMAKVPEGMSENIKATLERRSILGEYSDERAESVGVRELYLRKVLTAAAMLILPLSVLLWVVFGIIIPSPVGEKPVAVSNVSSQPEPVVWLVEKGSTAATDELGTFTTKLELASYEPIAVSAFIEKLIYENDLIDHTIPRRKAGESTYQITCDISAVADLLGELKMVWDKCDSTVLVVCEESDDEDIHINNVAFDQVIDVFQKEKLVSRTKLAKDFAHFNSMTADAPGKDVLVATKPGEVDEVTLPAVAKPTLTSGQKQPEASEAAAKGETVSLTILVKGL